MATIRRREHRRREDLMELTADQERHLTHGSFYFGGCQDRATFVDAWEIHGERLLAEWIAVNPGSRPFGWWLCDHGKERPVINGHDMEPNRRRHASENGTFGFLHTSIWLGLQVVAGEEVPVLFQESEADYLRRMKLLTPAEIASLKSQEVAPCQ